MAIGEYTDLRGFKHRTQVPDGSTDAKAGIHISVDFERATAYLGLPNNTLIAIQTILWNNGIVTPQDYFGAVYDKVVMAFAVHMPREEAKKMGNSLIANIREVTNAQRNLRPHDS